MAHDQQAGGPLDAKPDARVAGAVTHWGYRFTANGPDYADFTATLARITRWADWCREWGVTATGYEIFTLSISAWSGADFVAWVRAQPASDAALLLISGTHEGI